MTEPTVLDYFKSIFKDWKSFTAFLRAWADRADTTQLIKSPAVIETPSFNVERLTLNVQPANVFPWRSLLALFIALFAQRMFEPLGEPPQQNAILGVPLYLAAFALALWAFVRGEWTPASQPSAQSNTDPFTVRGIALILSLFAGGAAFLLLSDNTFTLLNVSVWVLSVVLFIRAFWLKESQSLWQKIADSLAHIRITRWDCWPRQSSHWQSPSVFIASPKSPSR